MDRRMTRMLSAGHAALLMIAGPASAGDLVLPDAAAQQRAEALLDDIDMQVRKAESATLTLEKWCATHDMAQPARIVVQRDAGAQQPATGAERSLLDVPADEPIRYRRVRLVCGSHVLSEAENWYVPARLTPAMNEALDGSDEPFGKVIRPLAPARRTLTNRRDWSADAGPSRCDETAFSHEALVFDGRGKPLALVTENYKLELLCGIAAAAAK